MDDFRVTYFACRRSGSCRSKFYEQFDDAARGFRRAVRTMLRDAGLLDTPRADEILTLADHVMVRLRYGTADDVIVPCDARAVQFVRASPRRRAYARHERSLLR